MAVMRAEINAAELDDQRSVNLLENWQLRRSSLSCVAVLQVVLCFPNVVDVGCRRTVRLFE
jgi:hypothetical protein